MAIILEPSTTSPEPEPAARASLPPLAPEPTPGRISQLAWRSFRLLNRWFMVPLLRAGLGPWMGTPLGGWILLLRVRGRRSGLVRDNPLSYLIADGAVWVMAGFGSRTEWYRNLLAEPRVEVVLPGRTLACTATVVGEPEMRRRIIPRLARAAGLPGYLTGVDPFRAPADDILAATAWVPLVRLQQDDAPIAPGPDDPGGLGWVWRQATVLLVGAYLVGRLRRLIGR